MWSYETTRAVSLLTTSSYSSSFSAELMGRQTITGGSLIQSVDETTQNSNVQSVSLYGRVENVIQRATGFTSVTASRSFSPTIENDRWTSKTDFTGENTANYTAGTYSARFTSVTHFSQVADIGGTVTGSTSIISSETGTLDQSTGDTYVYTTSSTAAAATYTRSTSSTRSETYYAGTTDASSNATTTTASRTASYDTTRTSTRTTTTRTGVTSSITRLAYRDTVAGTDWNEWLWVVTADDSSDVASNVGFSFTRTTLSESYNAVSYSFAISSGSVLPGPTTTWSTSRFSLTTGTSTSTTSVSSSYATQATASTGAPISLSTTSTASYHTTATNSISFSYHTATTTEEGAPYGSPGPEIFGLDTPKVTHVHSSTVTTTSAASGTITSLITQTVWSYDSSRRFVYNRSSVYDDSGTDDHYSNTQTTAQGITMAYASTALATNRGHSFGPADVSYKEPDITPGFQDPRSMGYAQPFGTGIAGGESLIGEWGYGFPGLFVPILDAVRHETTVGGQAMTVQYVSSVPALYTTTSTTNTDSQRVDGTGSVAFSLDGTRQTSQTRVNTLGGATVGGWGYETATTRFTTLSLDTSTHSTDTSATSYSFVSLSNTYTTTEDGGPGNPDRTVTSGDSYTGTVATTVTGTTDASRHPGIHMVTQQDSTHGSESHFESWTNADRTSSIKRRDWLAYESAAALYRATSQSAFDDTAGSLVVTFEAFPGN